MKQTIFISTFVFLLFFGNTSLYAQSEKQLKKAEKIMSKIRDWEWNEGDKHTYPSLFSTSKKFRKAAELGHPLAQAKYAEICYTRYSNTFGGWTKEANYEKGYDLFKKAEEGGEVLAKFGLANYYYYGYIFPKDINKAISYYTEFLENCDNASHKIAYLKALLNNGIFYNLKAGYSYYKRTDLANTNLEVMYAADLLQYQLGNKACKESSEWGYFERSYIKGYPKAKNKIMELAEKGDISAIRVLNVEKADNKRIEELFANMEKSVKSKDYLLPDSNGASDIKRYMRRYDKSLWPSGMEEKLNQSLPFYQVMEWTNMDMSKKNYSVSFFGALSGADNYDYDIEQIDKVINICKEETRPEYSDYYRNCLTILNDKIDVLIRNQYKDENAYKKLWGKILSKANSLPSSHSSNTKSGSDTESKVDADQDIDYTDKSDYNEIMMLERPHYLYALEKKVEVSDGTIVYIYKPTYVDENYWGGYTAYSTEKDAVAAAYFAKKHHIKREKGKTKEESAF